MQIWQERIFYVQMNNSQNITFLTKLIILNVYGFWAISCWDFRRNSNRVAKTAHCMLGGTFEEKQSFEKMQNFFRTANETFSAGLLKKLPTFLAEVFNGKKIPFEKILSFLGPCRSIFRITGRNFSARCSKLHFSCSEEHRFQKNCIWKLISFSDSDMD